MSHDLPDEWTPEQVRVFGAVYDAMIGNQPLVKHPDAPMAMPRHWQTLAHNAAFLAASAMDEERGISLVSTDDPETVIGTFFDTPSVRQ